MDTSTHFVMGVGLFGLAHIDPMVVTHHETAMAILAATVIGSQLPDSDGLYRLKGAAEYIRNHRGWTHSLPMIFIWPLLLTLLLSFFFPEADQGHVFLWSIIAVFIHVFIDLFNTYGTQAFRPFSREWVSWNILSIFDPFIFGIHLLGFILWGITSIPPSPIFLSVYIVMIAYIIWRTWIHHHICWRLKKEVETGGRITITPTIRWNIWNTIVENMEEVQIGELRNGRLFWTGYLSTGALTHPAVIKSKEADSVDAFLSLTSYGYPLLYKRFFGYEVRWLDVRYHYKKHFPFVAVAFLDHKYVIHHSFVGFMGEKQLSKQSQEFETVYQKEVHRH